MPKKLLQAVSPLSDLSRNAAQTNIVIAILLMSKPNKKYSRQASVDPRHRSKNRFRTLAIF